jgi:ribosomal protein L44E
MDYDRNKETEMYWKTREQSRSTRSQENIPGRAVLFVPSRKGLQQDKLTLRYKALVCDECKNTLVNVFGLTRDPKRRSRSMTRRLERLVIANGI